MKKFFILAVFTLSTTVISFGQNKITQTRDVTGFNSIDLKIWATVYVTQDNHFSVQVTGPQEWLEKISTEVDDEDLEISVESKDWSKDFMKNKPDVIINISMPKINELNVSGSGTITSQNSILTDMLSLDIHGSGTINVAEFKAGKFQTGVYGSGYINIGKGTAESIEEEVQGSGSIKSSSLMGSLVSISLAGSGDIKVEDVSSEKLEAETSGSGNVKISKGIVNDLALATTGSGSISASDLVGKKVSAQVAGSGSISVGVLDILDASIAGSGSVVYKGSPSNISKSISGSGSVRQN